MNCAILIAKFEESLIRKVYEIQEMEEEHDEKDDIRNRNKPICCRCKSKFPQNHSIINTSQQVVGSILGYVPRSNWARAPDENRFLYL